MIDKYDFRQKYRNRADISVLVVDKSVNPLDDEQTKHEIYGVTYFLSGYGFTVDLVWSLTQHKFDSFDGFCASILSELEERLRKDSERKDELRESFARIAQEEIDGFRSLTKLLRKSPINSIEDLAKYDFFIMHPSIDDCVSGFLLDIAEQYPAKPILMLSSSVAAASVIKSQETPVEGVTKDSDDEVYCIGDAEDFNTKAIELIEYLLDRKEASPTQIELPFP